MQVAASKHVLKECTQLNITRRLFVISLSSHLFGRKFAWIIFPHNSVGGNVVVDHYLSGNVNSVAGQE